MRQIFLASLSVCAGFPVPVPQAVQTGRFASAGVNSVAFLRHTDLASDAVAPRFSLLRIENRESSPMS